MKSARSLDVSFDPLVNVTIMQFLVNPLLPAMRTLLMEGSRIVEAALSPLSVDIIYGWSQIGEAGARPAEPTLMIMVLIHQAAAAERGLGPKPKLRRNLGWLVSIGYR